MTAHNVSGKPEAQMSDDGDNYEGREHSHSVSGYDSESNRSVDEKPRFPQSNFFTAEDFQKLYEDGKFTNMSLVAAFELLVNQPATDPKALYTVEAESHTRAFNDALSYLYHCYKAAGDRDRKRSVLALKQRWLGAFDTFYEWYKEGQQEALVGARFANIAAKSYANKRRRLEKFQTGLTELPAAKRHSNASSVSPQTDASDFNAPALQSCEPEPLPTPMPTSSQGAIGPAVPMAILPTEDVLGDADWLTRYNIVSDVSILNFGGLFQQYGDKFDKYEAEEAKVRKGLVKAFERTKFADHLATIYPPGSGLSPDAETDEYTIITHDVDERATPDPKVVDERLQKLSAATGDIASRCIHDMIYRIKGIFLDRFYWNLLLDPSTSEFEYRSCLLDHIFNAAFAGERLLKYRIERENQTLASARAIQNGHETATGVRHDGSLLILLPHYEILAAVIEVVGGPATNDGAKKRDDARKILKELHVMEKVLTEPSKANKLMVTGVLIYREYRGACLRDEPRRIPLTFLFMAETHYYIWVGRFVEDKIVIREVQNGQFPSTADDWHGWEKVITDVVELRLRALFLSGVLQLAHTTKSVPTFKKRPVVLEVPITPWKRSSRGSSIGKKSRSSSISSRGYDDCR
ncbi:uncharacterized protein EV422DRAFT_537881 [Fimicolochytrium jonesii]|uniref:uncharacterized protein n=1 Tax=Fimicolochytrium jonesii TaxID=1396493 RepID=UPI0022FE0B2C|nr:uncharacterized protein EV422DRAFT_537881 [Fimicolochytrium jonesii]KAI8818274.1 hypothetical protein EV422DRAFT_537881 [Fimicolochytrium jonesii]